MEIIFASVKPISLSLSLKNKIELAKFAFYKKYRKQEEWTERGRNELI